MNSDYNKNSAGCSKVPLILTTAILTVFFIASQKAHAARPHPNRWGIALSAGHIYDPGHARDQLALLSVFLKTDHDRAALFDTPDFLRFKLEATVGKGKKSPWDGMAAFNMLSLCYIERLETERVKPYIEGGIGISYHKRRWEGQGLNLTHNPVAGAGIKVKDSDGKTAYQIAIRLFHASNGGLHRDNKAMNAVLLSTGFIF